MDVLSALTGVVLGAVLGAFLTEWHEGRRRRTNALDALVRLQSSLVNLEVGIRAVVKNDDLVEIPSWANSVFAVERMREELHDARRLLSDEEIEFVRSVISPLEILPALFPAWQPSEPDYAEVRALRRLISGRHSLERSRGIRSSFPWSASRRLDKQLRAAAEAGLEVIDTGGFSSDPDSELD